MKQNNFKKQVLQAVSNISILSTINNSESFSFEKVVKLFQHIGWLYINIFKIMKLQPAGMKIFNIESYRRKKAKKKKQDFIDGINEIAKYQLWDKKNSENLTFSEGSIVFGNHRSYWRKRSIKDISGLSDSLQEYYREEIIDFIKQYCNKLEATWIHQ